MKSDTKFFELHQSGPRRIKSIPEGARKQKFHNEDFLNSMAATWPWTSGHALFLNEPVWWLKLGGKGADLKGISRSGRMVSIEGKRNYSRAKWPCAINQALYGIRLLDEFSKKDDGNRLLSPFRLDLTTRPYVGILVDGFEKISASIEATITKGFRNRIENPEKCDWSIRKSNNNENAKNWFVEHRDLRMMIDVSLIYLTQLEGPERSFFLEVEIRNLLMK